MRARLLYSPVLVDAGAGQTDENPPAATVRQPVTVHFCNFLSRRLPLPARPTVHIAVQGPTYNLSSQVGRTSAIIT